ncbi:AAA family ATPase [Candidatus Phytoplasma fraxini]|uniref:ATPase n=1 Tax=Ash yellows phytoplasma TaxID=35780 RepID=A0ABZ2U971_ASHYP
MNKNKFIGRQSEMSLFKNKIETDFFEFGLLYGRRRIGKTMLLREIQRLYPLNSIYYPANSKGIDSNLKELSRIIADFFQEPVFFQRYEDIFKYLVKKNYSEQIIIMIDEFTYLIDDDRSILTIFQNIIDDPIIKNSSLKLILSGNHIGMIEDMISLSQPLFGRATFQKQLHI